MTAADVEMVRELRYVHGWTCERVARCFGVTGSRILQIAPGRPGKVDNGALRDSFVGARVPASTVAFALGWTYVHSGTGRVHADVTRVKRTLGLVDTVTGGGRQRRRMIDSGTAGQIAEAIGLDPWRVGA